MMSEVSIDASPCLIESSHLLPITTINPITIGPRVNGCSLSSLGYCSQTESLTGDVGPRLEDENCSRIERVFASFRPLFIIDFDDTLQATWYLRGEMSKRSSCLLRRDLTGVDSWACSCMSLCLSLGEVVVLTNSELQWVSYSTENFLPRLNALLRRVTVVSARDNFSRKYPENPLAWKVHALKDLFPENTQNQLNHVVSIGDSHIDHQAARTLKSNLRKCVYFAKRPSPETLTRQLYKLCSGKLETLVRDSLSLKIYFDH